MKKRSPLVLVLLLGACAGGHTNDAEAGGAPGIGDHAAGAGGAKPESAVAGGGSDDGQGGGGGDPDVDPETTVTDLAELDGRSFTLTDSLCPPGLSDNSALEGAPESMLGFHLRRGPSGDFEAVTFTRTRDPVEALPDVHVSPLVRSGDHFTMRDVPTCGREVYDIENEYINEPVVADTVRLLFTRGSDGTLSATLSVKAPDGAPLESRAVIDSHAPELLVVDNEVKESIAPLGGTLDRFFVLSEPADPASTFSVKDGNGSAVTVNKVVVSGFLVGFHVPHALSADASFRARLVDLAGNASVTKQAYPGIALEPASGDFEGPTDFFTRDVWSDGEAFGCEKADIVDASSDGVGARTGLPPLAGERSLYLAGVDCQALLRLRRPSGTTKLLFEARVRAIRPPLSTTLDLGLLALDVGQRDALAQLEPDWQEDQALASTDFWVSSVKTLSLELPPTGDDFLFTIQPGAELEIWLDSLRFE